MVRLLSTSALKQERHIPSPAATATAATVTRSSKGVATVGVVIACRDWLRGCCSCSTIVGIAAAVVVLGGECRTMGCGLQGRNFDWVTAGERVVAV